MNTRKELAKIFEKAYTEEPCFSDWRIKLLKELAGELRYSPETLIHRSLRVPRQSGVTRSLIELTYLVNQSKDVHGAQAIYVSPSSSWAKDMIEREIGVTPSHIDSIYKNFKTVTLLNYSDIHVFNSMVWETPTMVFADNTRMNGNIYHQFVENARIQQNVIKLIDIHSGMHEPKCTTIEDLIGVLKQKYSEVEVMEILVKILKGN